MTNETIYDYYFRASITGVLSIATGIIMLFLLPFALVGGLLNVINDALEKKQEDIVKKND